MRNKIILMMVCVLAFATAISAQNAGSDRNGSRSQVITFDNGNCTARFNRSASGIINETQRTCDFFGFEDVHIQFRPLDGRPNPSCETFGLLVPTFTYTNTDPALMALFGSQTYNVCSYLESAESSGEFTFDNVGFEATVSYTAGNLASSEDELAGQGTLTYTDSRITYTASVKYIKTVGNTTWIAAKVTSVNGTICCQVGNYVFYKLVDNGEPGTGVDQVSGADLGPITDAEARAFVESMFSPPSPNPFTITSGNIEVY